jgi:hypothetical protein
LTSFDIDPPWHGWLNPCGDLDELAGGGFRIGEGSSTMNFIAMTASLPGQSSGQRGLEGRLSEKDVEMSRSCKEAAELSAAYRASGRENFRTSSRST